MSAPEVNAAPVESRSSVKLVLNAKGEVQVDIKAYVGDSQEDLTRAREIAVRTFHDTLAAVGRKAVA